MYFDEQKYNNKNEGKSHTVGAGDCERKKSVFFVLLILSEEIFLTFILSECMVYSIHFQNMHTFTYQKKLLHTIFCLFLKSSKAFSASLI